MDSLLESAFGVVLDAGLNAAVVAAVVLGLSCIFRQSLTPAWRHNLWLLVLVRALMPAAPPSPTSLWNIASPARVPVAHRQAAQRVSIAVQVPRRTLPEAFEFASETPPSTKIESAHVASPWTTAVEVHPQKRWRLLTAWAWFCGVLLLATRAVTSGILRIVRRRRSILQPAGAETLRILGDCRREIGLRRRVGLEATDRVGTPAVAGLFRPRILLPIGAEEALSPEELRHVFLHELAHVKRFDVVTRLLASVAAAVQWFNPVVWYACRQLDAAREAACDRMAIECIGVPRKAAYGRTVLRLVERSWKSSPVPGSLGILGRRNAVKGRIQMLVSMRTNGGKWAALFGGLLCCIVAATTMTQTRVEADEVPGVHDKTTKTYPNPIAVSQPGTHSPKPDGGPPKAVSYDMGKVIRRLGAKRGVTADRVKEVAWNLIRDVDPGNSDHEWVGEELRLTRIAEIHRRFDFAIRTCMENSIDYSLRIIEATDAAVEAMGVEWHLNQDDSVAPTSTRTGVDSPVSKPRKTRRVDSDVAATERSLTTSLGAAAIAEKVVARRVECRLAILDAAAVDRILVSLGKFAEVKTICSPKGNLQSGTSAFILCGNSIPFVEDVVEVDANGEVGYDPILRTTQDGLNCVLKAGRTGGDTTPVSYEFRWASLRSLDPESFQVSRKGRNGSTATATVQTPEVETTCIRGICRLKKTETLILQSVYNRPKDGRRTPIVVLLSAVERPPQID